LHFGGKWIKKSHSQINQPANFSEIEKNKIYLVIEAIDVDQTVTVKASRWMKPKPSLHSTKIKSVPKQF
jgi:hypothetical protein